MNNKEVPYLEYIPGINIEEEKKETEVKVSSNKQLPLETNQAQQPIGKGSERKESIPIIDEIAKRLGSQVCVCAIDVLVQIYIHQTYFFGLFW